MPSAGAAQMFSKSGATRQTPGRGALCSGLLQYGEAGWLCEHEGARHCSLKFLLVLALSPTNGNDGTFCFQSVKSF